MIDKQFWLHVNLLARSYLQLQQTRVGTGLRLMAMEDQALIDAGLIIITRKIKEDPETGETTVSRTKKQIDDPITAAQVDLTAKRYQNAVKKHGKTSKQAKNPLKRWHKAVELHDEAVKEIQEKIKAVKLQVAKESEPYRILQAHHKLLFKEEKGLLNAAVTAAQGTDLHRFCLSVRGFGEVATLTLLGYINPATMKTPAQMWANFGMTPHSRMRKGQQSNYNPKIKGRFWMITRNVLMARDPYYTPFFRIKKEYYRRRPDLLALKEKKPNGWNAKINGMAYRVLMKLLLSNAWEILYKSYHNGKRWQDDPNHKPHRNYIPPKPASEKEWAEIHERFGNSQNILLHELNVRYPNEEDLEEDPNLMDEYVEYMSNAKIDG